MSLGMSLSMAGDAVVVQEVPLVRSEEKLPSGTKAM